MVLTEVNAQAATPVAAFAGAKASFAPIPAHVESAIGELMDLITSLPALESMCMLLEGSIVGQSGIAGNRGGATEYFFFFLPHLQCLQWIAIGLAALASLFGGNTI